jgi:tetratricopeptide (TPR) repeat protein
MKKCLLSALLLLLFLVTGCNTDPNVAKQRYVENGNKYFEKGKYKEALIMYRNALKRDLKFGEAYYRSALAEIELARVGDAVRDLQRAIELQPENLDAHDRLTNLYINAYLSERKKPKWLVEELRAMADKLAKRFPNSYSQARLLGYLALFDNDPDAALKEFGKANQIKPLQPDLVMIYMQTLAAKNRGEEAEKLGYEMLAKDPTALPVYDVMYLFYARQNKPAEAEKILLTKVAKNPKSAEAHLQLAAHYRATQKRDEMLSALKPILSNSQDFPSAPLIVGDFFARIREYDLAAQQYKDGIEKSPKEKHSYQKRLIEVLIRQNHKDEASQMVNAILKEDPKDSEAIAIRASLSLMTGTPEQLQSAINDLQTVISRMPENFVVRYNLGRALLAKQNWEAARVQFEEAIKLRPDYLPARITLAQVLLQNREFSKVVQMSQDILAYDSANVPARLLRSRALIELGQIGQARQELTQTSQQFPQLPEARLQIAALDLRDKNFKSAEESFRKIYGQSQDPRAFIGLVDTYVAQNEPATALKLLRDELAKTPDRLDYRVAVARISARTGDYRTAVSEYQKVLEKAPRSSQVWLDLSEVYRASGDSGNAVSAVKKAQELAPSSVGPHLQLAMLYDTTGRKTEAKPVYEQVLRIQPNNAVALNNLAYILAETGNDLDQALTMAQKARQQRPNDEDVADTLGWIYIKKNLPDSAIAVFRELVQKNPKRAAFHYHLAMALFQKGDKVQAKQECEAALRNEPSAEDSVKIKELLSKIG